MMKTQTINSKQPLDWFTNRVGTWIFRAPIFSSEQNRPFVAVRVKDQNHAKMLFDLQRADRPGYVDKESDVIKK